LVDLTHEVAAQDVVEGQLALEASSPFFPAGTVHLAVVDPGVGSARRPLVVASGGQFFVGPDNGLFSFAFDREGWSAVMLEARDLRLPALSATFHGRDVFAPAAAHLAAGVPFPRFGRGVSDPVRASIPVARIEGHVLVGEVLFADHFGNLVTSIRASDVDRLSDAAGPGASAIGVDVEGRRLGSPVSSYASGVSGQPAPIMGSAGRLEIFVRDGSARVVLGAGRGTPVTARLPEVS